MKKRFKLLIDIPSSTQSDIAFLLIIFFIITAVFVRKDYIKFNIIKSSGTEEKVILKKVIKVKLYNNKILINNEQIKNNNILLKIKTLLRNKEYSRNIVIEFKKDLKYNNFIIFFEKISQIKNIKIKIKELK